MHVQQRVVEPAPAVALVLVQALAKGDRDEMAIEAATEVGVDAVVPWQAERSIVVWRGERAAKSRARWLGTVRAAAKQSRRARVPDVEVALDGRGLVERVRAVVAAGGVALVLHEDAREPIAATALPATGRVPGRRRPRGRDRRRRAGPSRGGRSARRAPRPARAADVDRRARSPSRCSPSGWVAGPDRPDPRSAAARNPVGAAS